MGNTNETGNNATNQQQPQNGAVATEGSLNKREGGNFPGNGKGARTSSRSIDALVEVANTLSKRKGFLGDNGKAARTNNQTIKNLTKVADSMFGLLEAADSFQKLVEQMDDHLVFQGDALKIIFQKYEHQKNLIALSDDQVQAALKPTLAEIEHQIDQVVQIETNLMVAQVRLQDMVRELQYRVATHPLDSVPVPTV